jgi:two-component system, NtrC family, sensor histidine kinase AtoS
MDMNATASLMARKRPQAAGPVLPTFPRSSAAYERLQHLERLASVGMLSSNVAHEIKNALVGVKTFVELLAREHPDSELATLAAAEVVRIQSLVSSLLQIGRTPQQEWRMVRLHRLIDEVISLLRQSIRAKRLKIERQFHRGSDAALGNRDELKQAMLNLLLNAIDASDTDGTIQVRTRATASGMLAIAVQDFGTGIRPENLQRLFEPFFTTKADGTGLGLSITKRILTAHGGAIEVSSMPGQGSTFTLSLPLAR